MDPTSRTYTGMNAVVPPVRAGPPYLAQFTHIVKCGTTGCPCRQESFKITPGQNQTIEGRKALPHSRHLTGGLRSRSKAARMIRVIH